MTVCVKTWFRHFTCSFANMKFTLCFQSPWVKGLQCQLKLSTLWPSQRRNYIPGYTQKCIYLDWDETMQFINSSTLFIDRTQNPTYTLVMPPLRCLWLKVWLEENSVSSIKNSICQCKRQVGISEDQNNHKPFNATVKEGSNAPHVPQLYCTSSTRDKNYVKHPSYVADELQL